MREHRYRLMLVLLVFASLAPISVQAIDESVVEVIVEKNDNLINLCKKHLEDPTKWPEIARINKLDDSNYISPGQRLIIPVRLLKRVQAEGRVVFAKGDIVMQSPEKESWKSVRMDDIVRPGYLIKTGPDSAVEVVFGDGSSFYQEPDTLLELTTQQERGTVNLMKRIFLKTGRLLMKIRSVTGSESRIEIQTPAAALTPRGTEFRVTVGINDTTHSEVFQGIVDAEAAGQKVSIEAGEGTRINKGEPPAKPRKLLPPPAFVDVRPGYGTMPFTIALAQIEGAVAYRILLSKDEEGKDVVQEKVLRSGEGWEAAGLENGVYYLRSRSIDELGLEGASSAPSTITVHILPLPPIVHLPTLDEQKLRVQWTDREGRTAYHVQVARAENFLDPILDTKVDRPEITLPLSRETGRYFVRVSTIDPSGQEGAFSPALSVESKSSSPLALVIIVEVVIAILMFAY
jgi:hypothetical protein